MRTILNYAMQFNRVFSKSLLFLCLASFKRTQVLVVEIWDGTERCCGHRCHWDELWTIWYVHYGSWGFSFLDFFWAQQRLQPCCLVIFYFDKSRWHWQHDNMKILEEVIQIWGNFRIFQGVVCVFWIKHLMLRPTGGFGSHIFEACDDWNMARMKTVNLERGCETWRRSPDEQMVMKCYDSPPEIRV